MTKVQFPSMECEIISIDKFNFRYKSGDRAGQDGHGYTIKMARPEDRFAYEVTVFDDEEGMRCLKLLQENKPVRVTFGVSSRNRLEVVLG